MTSRIQNIGTLNTEIKRGPRLSKILHFRVFIKYFLNPKFKGDVNALYKQWKKVRDRYVREKRKLRMTSGVEQEEPNWDLYRELMWIDPYLEERAA